MEGKEKEKKKRKEKREKELEENIRKTQEKHILCNFLLYLLLLGKIELDVSKLYQSSNEEMIQVLKDLKDKNIDYTLHMINIFKIKMQFSKKR